MNWDFFWNESMCIDNTYIEALGALVGYRDAESEIFDAYAMLFGMPL